MQIFKKVDKIMLDSQESVYKVEHVQLIERISHEKTSQNFQNSTKTFSHQF